MKRLIIITIILIAATVMVTVKYFKNLNPLGQQASKVINTIPTSAALVFEFNNSASFYDIYKKNQLFETVTGPAKMQELHTLRNAILNNASLKPYLDGQFLYLSIHPQKGDSVEYLFTLPTREPVPAAAINLIGVKQIKIAGRSGYSYKTNPASKELYFAERTDRIWMGSFSRTLLEEALNSTPPSKESIFEVLPEQQHATSLGNLYVNYKQTALLIDQFYKSNNVDLWNGLTSMPVTTVLSLNYKSDAFLFNGITSFKSNSPQSYVELFKTMKPVEMKLNDIFPLTTAYSTSYGVDNVEHFIRSLTTWFQKAGFSKDKKALFQKIKTESGVQLDKEFHLLLDNEFAVLTTRFQEKLAIIKIRNGASLRPVLNNISTMATDDVGQFNYDKVPLFLIGDALIPFRRPYFTIIDNYLVLANSRREISNYAENYFNNEFLGKKDAYIDFTNLLPQRGNVNYFIHFKNAGYVLKRVLKRSFAEATQQEPGLKDLYAGSYQLSATDDHGFYTSLCIKMNKPDTLSVNK
jgi:hypothetical protein